MKQSDESDNVLDPSLRSNLETAKCEPCARLFRARSSTPQGLLLSGTLMWATWDVAGLEMGTEAG
jgi:hypothetical protein